MSLRFTPLDEIPKIHARLSKTFDSGKTLPLEYRRSQLLALARMTQENTNALLGALYSDLGRHKLEGNLPEIGPIVATCIMTANALEEWTKPEKPQVEEWRANWDTTIHKAPKGLVVNIRWVHHLELYLDRNMISSQARGTTPSLSPCCPWQVPSLQAAPSFLNHPNSALPVRR